MNEKEIDDFLEEIGYAKGERLVGAKVNPSEIVIFLDDHVIRIKQSVDCRCIDCLKKEEGIKNGNK